MFCNVPVEAVIEETDVAHTIYEVPLMLQKEKLDSAVCRLLELETPPPAMEDWSRFVRQVIFPSRKVRVAVVGKYIELKDAYKSIYESLTHAAAANDAGLEVLHVDAEAMEETGAAANLAPAQGILIPGGFGDRGIEGKIAAASFARNNRVPYLGLCLGMQIAVIEYARNVLGLPDANSKEFDPATPHPVITLLKEQENITHKGATMRLGSWPCQLRPGTRAAEAYGREQIHERHRHRYEFNPAYREALEAAGMIVSGASPDSTLAEIVEIRDHPWFVGCQFHPEFQSKPTAPHPLFLGFIRAVLQHASD
jgi:CTP synthase